jgi:hypothetical protein
MPETVPERHYRDRIQSVRQLVSQLEVEAKERVLGRWVVASPQEMAKAKAAIARGETQDADEGFAEIAGTVVATWRKSIEEYKGSRERPVGK